MPAIPSTSSSKIDLKRFRNGWLTLNLNNKPATNPILTEEAAVAQTQEIEQVASNSSILKMK